MGEGWWPPFSTGSGGKDAVPGRDSRCLEWGREGQAWSSAPGAPQHEQSLNQCYGREVAGVRGPPLLLWYRGGQQAPALESRVLGLDAGPKELLCDCFAIVLGQLATKVCWQDVSVDLLVEGFQLLTVHKDLEGDGSDPQQRTRAALPNSSVSPKDMPLPAGPLPTLTLSSSLLFRNGLTTL